MKKGTAILIIAVIIFATIACITCYQVGNYFGNNAGYGEGYDDGMGYGYARWGVLIPYYETELTEFIEEVETKIIYVLEVEPVEIVIYPMMECQEVLYNITYYQLTKEEAENQSIEIWLTNKTERTRWMMFAMALPNGQDSFREDQLYQFYYLQLGYKYYSVIYYTIVHTGNR